LPLNVDQAALNNDARPEAPEHVSHVRIAIDSEATGAQAVPYLTLKEYSELWSRTLGDAVLASDKDMGLSIHQRNETTWAVNESAVQDEVVASSQAQSSLWGRLLKVVVDHAIKLPRAMPALARELPDRVAFHDPTPEPLPFVGRSGFLINPTEGMPALGAIPPLPPVGIMAVSLDNARTARTAFF
jgi:hypothetical protein